MKRKTSRNPKRAALLRRAIKTRKKQAELDVPRLSVRRSAKHIYAQIVHKGLVLVSASSTEKQYDGSKSGNIEASKIVGKLVGVRAVEKGLSKVAFDRSGYKYHGRVKAVADAAREAGLTI
ncbi:MAG: 50S ribosomal protein L18 [Gammaproteobacteria bacterium]|jgi:large subunit ribosomal protein L18